VCIASSVTPLQPIDVKNVLEKIKNVKKRKKRGQNKKRLKTLLKNVSPYLFNVNA